MSQAAMTLALQEGTDPATLKELKRLGTGTEEMTPPPEEMPSQEPMTTAGAEGATRAALPNPRRQNPPTKKGRPKGTTSQATGRRVGQPRSQPRPQNPPGPDVTDDSEEEDGTSSLREGLERLAQAGQRGAKKVTAPREDDWAEFMAVVWGLLSAVFAWWIASGLIVQISKQEREDLELTEDEADGLARPMARILARSALNKRYGSEVLGMTDYILMLVVIVGYTERISPLIKARIRDTRETRQQRRRSPAPPKEQRNGHVAEQAQERPRTVPQGAVIVPPLGANAT